MSVCVRVSKHECVCDTPFWTEPPDCTLGCECEYPPINYLTILWTWHCTPGSLTQLLSPDWCSFFPNPTPSWAKEVCFSQGFVTILHVRLDRRSIETKVNVTWKLTLYIDSILLHQIWMVCRFHNLYAYPKQNVYSWFLVTFMLVPGFDLLLIYTNSLNTVGIQTICMPGLRPLAWLHMKLSSDLLSVMLDEWPSPLSQHLYRKWNEQTNLVYTNMHTYYNLSNMPHILAAPFSSCCLARFTVSPQETQPTPLESQRFSHG